MVGLHDRRQGGPVVGDTTGRAGYRERVHALSSAQKALLQTRIAQAGGAQPRSTGGRLIACLVTRDGAAIDKETLRDHCRQHLPEYMLPQRFVILDALPRTAAGKVDRLALQSRDVAAPVRDDSGPVAPRNQIETRLATIWAEVLGFDDISIHDDFFEVGGDSLLSIRILSRAGKAGLSITPEAFFSHPTIAQQAQIATVAPAIKAESGVISGRLPLLPIQHWFFERITAQTQHWNQSLLFSVEDSLTREVFERAVQRLLLHHDALRTRFAPQDENHQASIDELHGELPLRWVDLADQSDAERNACIERTANEINGGFDLGVAPLIHFAWFDYGPDDGGHLLIVAHHLVVDAESWPLLLADLESLIEQIGRGEKVRLPAKTSSIKTWATRLAETAHSQAIESGATYWSARGALPVAPIPRDYSATPGDNTEALARILTVALDRDTTQELVQRLPQQFNSRMSDALVCTLARVVAKWTDSANVRFDMEGHGREALFDDVDISRTVGWFTSVFPVTLQGDELVWSDAVDALRTTKEQLRALPLNGLGYGLLRELCGDRDIATALRALPPAPILFNYLGRVEPIRSGRLRLADARCGQARSPRANRAYLIEINAQIADDALSLEWRYSENIHDRATIATLAAQFLRALRELLEVDVSSLRAAYAPSDFPLAGLGQSELDDLSNLLDDLDDGH